jgi:hypothetical protein
MQGQITQKQFVNVQLKIHSPKQRMHNNGYNIRRRGTLADVADDREEDGRVDALLARSRMSDEQQGAASYTTHAVHRPRCDACSASISSSITRLIGGLIKLIRRLAACA